MCRIYIMNSFCYLPSTDIIVANVRSCFNSRRLGGCGCGFALLLYFSIFDLTSIIIRINHATI